MASETSHLYAQHAYAAALSGPDNVVEAPGLATPLLRRPILSGGYDLAGPYPMTVLRPQDDLQAALRALRAAGFVSLVCVPDPLRSPAVGALEAAFQVCRPFKTHYLIDPAIGAFAPSKHHRDRIRRALRRCRVDREILRDRLSDWGVLYAELVEHRAISGTADFQPDYFEMLAGFPRLEAFVARADEAVVGMTLWFSDSGVTYNHLTAVNAAGYQAGASYALYAAAVEHFADQCVNLGGGAGAGDGAGGLAEFKRGFANSEIVSRVCGSILDPEAYAALSRARPPTEFFPAYRAPAA